MKHPHILIVDDEEDIRWAFENILRPIGYTVTCADSSSVAFTQLERHSYVIAFIDIKLPGQDGFEIALHIIQNHPNTSIVLISGYHNKEDNKILKWIVEGNIMGFISKPFNLQEVRSLARQANQKYEERRHA